MRNKTNIRKCVHEPHNIQSSAVAVANHRNKNACISMKYIGIIVAKAIVMYKSMTASNAINLSFFPLANIVNIVTVANWLYTMPASKVIYKLQLWLLYDLSLGACCLLEEFIRE